MNTARISPSHPQPLASAVPRSSSNSRQPALPVAAQHSSHRTLPTTDTRTGPQAVRQAPVAVKQQAVVLAATADVFAATQALAVYPAAQLQSVPEAPRELTGDLVESSASVPTSSNNLVHFLLPAFPASPSGIDSTTILSNMVMRRLNGAISSSNGRPGSGSSSGRPGTGSSSGSQNKKPIWQSHQLVLTSFRLNESTRNSRVEGSEVGSASAIDALASSSQCRTIAHLHLFAQSSLKAKSSSPATIRAWLTSPESTEVERRAIDQQTTAGVWDNGQDGVAESKRETPEKGRRYVMRIRWEMEDEWLCDMPNRWELC